MPYVNSAYTFTDNTNSLVATAPASIAAGNTLIALLTQDTSGATFGAPAGWTLLPIQNITNGDTQTVAWAWKVALAGDVGVTTYTFTGSSGNNMAAIIAQYSGEGATPIATSSTNNPNLSTPPSSPVTCTGSSVTTTAINDIVMMACVDCASGGSGTFVANGSLTLRNSSNASGFGFCPVALADFTQSSAGATGNQTFTWTNASDSGNFVAFLVALGSSGAAAPSIALMPSSSVVFHYID